MSLTCPRYSECSGCTVQTESMQSAYAIIWAANPVCCWNLFSLWTKGFCNSGWRQSLWTHTVEVD